MSGSVGPTWAPGDRLILPGRGLCEVSHRAPDGDVWIRVAGRVLEPWERWTETELAGAVRVGAER